MTREELLEIITPKMAEVKKKIELSPNAPYIFAENSITYMGSDFEEHDEYNEHDDMTLLASLTVSIRDRYAEDDPTVSFCMSFELKHSTVMDPGSIDSELDAFITGATEFSSKLDASENSTELIEAEYKRQEEEAKADLEELKKWVKRVKLYSYIGLGVLFGLALAALIFLAIVK